MKHCINCKYCKNYRWAGSAWCEGPQNIIVNYVSSKPDYRASKCINERTDGACGPAAKYYEPDFLTRTREFLLGAKPR